MGRGRAKSDKVKISIYVTRANSEELAAIALRSGIPVSWFLQRAWDLTKVKIQAETPTMTNPVGVLSAVGK